MLENIPYADGALQIELCVRSQIHYGHDLSEDIEWRILSRSKAREEEAHRYEAEIAGQGSSVLIVVSPEQIMGWDYNG